MKGYEDSGEDDSEEYHEHDSDCEKSDEDLSGSDHVRVVIRCRPINKSKGEKDGSSELTIFPDGKSVRVSTKGSKKSYQFLYIADPSQGQAAVFRKTGKHVVECALSGFNGAIVAYGQTGSGKTYTMQGPGLELQSGRKGESKGVIQRVCETIFAHKEQIGSDSNTSFSIAAEYLEIYNENVRDLLRPRLTEGSPRGAPKPPKVGIFEDAKGAIIVQNQTTVVVNSPEECYKLLMEGSRRRAVGATKMNDESSRSHAIFTLKIEKNDREKGIKRTSKLHLVDLAGSERQKGTGATGLRLKEAGGINKSLSALGNVINALAEREGARQRGEKPGRVPSYRDSKLTFLLKDSFGGNSKLCLIATISPALGYADETANTLEFAKRCCSVRNEAVVNEHLSEDIARLQAEVRSLQQTTKQLRANLAKAKNTEMELRAVATQVQTVPVQMRTTIQQSISRRKETKCAGVQTDETVNPFDDGEDIFNAVKTEDLTRALDSLIEGKLSGENKESRTEKLSILLTNAINRERNHYHREEELKRKVANSHRRWMEMVRANEDLEGALRKREEVMEKFMASDMKQTNDVRHQCLLQEVELLKAKIAKNPEAIMLRHRVATLQSELETSEAEKLPEDVRQGHEEKFRDLQGRYMDMLSINEEVIRNLRKTDDELHRLRQQGLEGVYGSEGRKLREELERVYQEKQVDPEKQLLRSKAAALENELVEFAQLSLAAQQEGYSFGAQAKRTSTKPVTTDFATELDDLDSNLGDSTDEESTKGNRRSRSRNSRKDDRASTRVGIFSKGKNSTQKRERSKREETAQEVFQESLQTLNDEEFRNLSPDLFTFSTPQSQKEQNVQEILQTLDYSVRNLESYVHSVDAS